MGILRCGGYAFSNYEALLMCPMCPQLVLRELVQIPEDGLTQPLCFHTHDPISLYPMYSTVATLQETTRHNRNQEVLPKPVSLHLSFFSCKVSPLRYFIAVAKSCLLTQPLPQIMSCLDVICALKGCHPFLIALAFKVIKA